MIGPIWVDRLGIEFRVSKPGVFEVDFSDTRGSPIGSILRASYDPRFRSTTMSNASNENRADPTDRYNDNTFLIGTFGPFYSAMDLASSSDGCGYGASMMLQRSYSGVKSPDVMSAADVVSWRSLGFGHESIEMGHDLFKGTTFK